MQTRRPAVSFEGLNSSLARWSGKVVWECTWNIDFWSMNTSCTGAKGAKATKHSQHMVLIHGICFFKLKY